MLAATSRELDRSLRPNTTNACILHSSNFYTDSNKQIFSLRWPTSPCHTLVTNNMYNSIHIHRAVISKPATGYYDRQLQWRWPATQSLEMTKNNNYGRLSGVFDHLLSLCSWLLQSLMTAIHTRFLCNPRHGLTRELLEQNALVHQPTILSQVREIAL